MLSCLAVKPWLLLYSIAFLWSLWIEFLLSLYSTPVSLLHSHLQTADSRWNERRPRAPLSALQSSVIMICGLACPLPAKAFSPTICFNSPSEIVCSSSVWQSYGSGGATLSIFPKESIKHSSPLCFSWRTFFIKREHTTKEDVLLSTSCCSSILDFVASPTWLDDFEPHTPCVSGKEMNLHTVENCKLHSLDTLFSFIALLQNNSW